MLLALMSHQGRPLRGGGEQQGCMLLILMSHQGRPLRGGGEQQGYTLLIRMSHLTGRGDGHVHRLHVLALCAVVFTLIRISVSAQSHSVQWLSL